MHTPIEKGRVEIAENDKLEIGTGRKIKYFPFPKINLNDMTIENKAYYKWNHFEMDWCTLLGFIKGNSNSLFNTQKTFFVTSEQENTKKAGRR